MSGPDSMLDVARGPETIPLLPTCAGVPYKTPFLPMTVTRGFAATLTNRCSSREGPRLPRQDHERCCNICRALSPQTVQFPEATMLTGSSTSPGAEMREEALRPHRDTASPLLLHSHPPQLLLLPLNDTP